MSLNNGYYYLAIFQKNGSGFLEIGKIRGRKMAQKFVRRSADVLPTS
jgi:hypothetical protein